MKISPLSISEVLLFEPEVIEDNRGFFCESFNLIEFKRATSRNLSFIQDNYSKSCKGVLRGLHYQLPPYAQGKIIQVLQGEVLDIVVDIRKSSSTFGQYVSQILSSKNKRQIWIPEGFAHGFLTLSNESLFFYKTTQQYCPQYEKCILWKDETLNINWGGEMEYRISSKDLLGENFLKAEVFE